MRFLIVWELIIIIVAVLQVEVVALLERELHFYGLFALVMMCLTDMDCRQDSHVHEEDLFTFTFVHLADAFYP